MGAFSNYAEGKVADALLRGVSLTSPGQVYIALFTGDPTEAGTGPETAYTNYARQSCGATPASAFSALDGNGTTKNTATLTFPAVGGASSVTVTHWALFDAASVGNMLLYGALTAQKTLDPTDVPSFPANALQITFD